MQTLFLQFDRPGFDWRQFEALILDFLSAGPTLEVLEPPEFGSNGSRSRNSKSHKIIRSQPFGGEGDDQRGIDITATTDSGEEWVFQCKHSPTIGLTETREAIQEASNRYPQADRYFLFVSGVVKPGALELVASEAKWEIWDGRTISSYLLARIPPRQAFTIVGRHFGELEARRLFPLTDQLLISPEEFFLPWTRQDQLFHHKAPLVGREEELDAFKGFINDPTLRVCILVARGGIGKTRLLKGLAEQALIDFPDREILFVNQAAARDAAPQSLRWSQDGQVVVIQDDAHRLEVLNPHLLTSLAQKKASKLLLAARPQALESLRETLLRHGYSSLEIRPLINLKPLKRAELERLAASLLGDGFRHLASSLAQAAHGCSLIVSVGAEVITRDLLTSPQLDGSSAFRDEVFLRLEGEELKRLADGGKVDQLKLLLRALAILSPWQNNEENAVALSAFGGYSRAELSSFLDRLEASGFVISTRAGFRVTPDLFSDHLVYSACYDKSGKLTHFAHRIRSELLKDYSVPVLRNLAEAEWRSLQESENSESILDYFWDGIRDNFEQADVYEKATILEQWQSFSVYQPDRALTLAKAALQSIKSLGPVLGNSESMEDFGRKHLLGGICAVSLPIAVYRDEYRNQCLDLIWAASELWPVLGHNDNRHPWKMIADVGAFHRNHPISAPKGMIAWLKSKFDSEPFKQIVSRPSNLLSVLLRPIFARTIEDNYSEGMTVHFRSLLIKAEAVSDISDSALDLLIQKAIPLGECAVLNTLSVIEEAISPIGGFYTGEITPEYLASWAPQRGNIVSLIRLILSGTTSYLVQFRVHDILRTAIKWNESPEFADDCVQLQQQLPDSFELRTARLFLSDAFDEFYEHAPNPRPENYSDGQKSERCREKWDQFRKTVAAEWIKTSENGAALFDSLAEITKRCNDCGLSPSLGELFRELACQDAVITNQLVERILESSNDVLDPWWILLFERTLPLKDPFVQNWVIRALGTSRPILKRMALHLVGARRQEIIPDALLDEITNWAGKAQKDEIPILIEVLGKPLYGDEFLPQRLLAALDVSEWNEKDVTKLVSALGYAQRASEGELSVSYVDQVFSLLEKVPNLDQEHAVSLLRRIARQAPRRVFDVFVQRIRLSDPNHRRYAIIPWRCEWGLPGLERETDYVEIASMVLQEVRARPKKQSDWNSLFEMAVLRTSDVGADLLCKWVGEASSPKEMHQLISLIAYRHSNMIFRFPEFVRTVLKKAATWSFESEKIRLNLIDSGRLTDRSNRNGTPSPGSSYICLEAERCRSVYSEDSELASFYKEVGERERREIESFNRVMQRDFDTLEEDD